MVTSFMQYLKRTPKQPATSNQQPISIKQRSLGATKRDQQ